MKIVHVQYTCISIMKINSCAKAHDTAVPLFLVFKVPQLGNEKSENNEKQKGASFHDDKILLKSIKAFLSNCMTCGPPDRGTAVYHNMSVKRRAYKNQYYIF